MYPSILVSYDGSPTSRKGLEEAIALAKALQSQLCVVHVVEDPLLMDYSGMVNLGEIWEILRRNGREMLADAVAQAAKAGITAQSKLLDGEGTRVSDSICAFARSWPAQLIVMGTHGRRGIGHLLLGSDAEAVIRTATVPVLLVRNPEAA